MTGFLGIRFRFEFGWNPTSDPILSLRPSFRFESKLPLDSSSRSQMLSRSNLGFSSFFEPFSNWFSFTFSAFPRRLWIIPGFPSRPWIVPGFPSRPWIVPGFPSRPWIVPGFPSLSRIDLFVDVLQNKKFKVIVYLKSSYKFLIWWLNSFIEKINMSLN